MKLAALLTGAIWLGLGAATAVAAEPGCVATIEATSRVHHALTPAYDGATPAKIKRSYDREFAKARDEAIAAWSAKARQECPKGSSRWERARSKSVEECDRAMGGQFTVCARAIPG